MNKENIREIVDYWEAYYHINNVTDAFSKAIEEALTEQRNETVKMIEEQPYGSDFPLDIFTSKQLATKIKDMGNE